MTTPQFTMRKTANGWQAKSCIDLPDNGEIEEGSKRELHITTSKSLSGYLVTYASACTVSDGFVRTRVFRDFHKLVYEAGDRCTERNVQAQQLLVLKLVPELLETAIAHEAAKQASEG